MTFAPRRALLLVLLWGAAAHADIFSPGELAKPHANLEGLPNCTKCHPAGSQLSQEACLACHGELKPEIGKSQGFHGRINDEKRACENCHHEHQGRELQLIDWGPKGQAGFEHLRAGWALNGAHAKTSCDKCHEKRLFTDKVALKLLERKPVTWLGLSKGCESCHFDEHRGQLEGSCAECHDEKAWKPAPKFDHAKTNYPLEGKHKAVKCLGCHPAQKDAEKHGFPAPVSEVFFKAAPVEHDSCLDCHKDFHNGQFGRRCSSCHTVEGWRIIRNAAQDRAFHDKTRFPLKGAHLDVACKDCHGPWPGQAPKFKGLSFEKCSDCHPDAHEGQLADPKKKTMPDCDACHGLDGFTPVKFGVEEHKATRYALEGSHTVVACDGCHEKNPQLSRQIPKPIELMLKKKRRKELFSFTQLAFSKTTDKCESCHADEHKGQFADEKKACSVCHQVTKWAALKFDHDKDSRYPLTGKHAQVPCSQCHWAPPGQTAKYRPVETACKSCHEDVHAGQLGAECEKCHQTSDFRKVSFDHRPPNTRFALDGKHAPLACDACHKRVLLKGGVGAVLYKPLPLGCEGCHKDFHQGAFKGFEP
ncbi:MAG: hypothetical protein QM723_01540 [Myxococcaceae bacterium]